MPTLFSNKQTPVDCEELIYHSSFFVDVIKEGMIYTCYHLSAPEMRKTISLNLGLAGQRLSALLTQNRL